MTGTDTGIGKTFVTTSLIRELRRRGSDAVGLKPVETGWSESTSDAAQLAAASGRSVEETVWAHFELPAAPAVAAAAESQTIDVTSLVAWIRAGHGIRFAEGAGGWMVPFTNDHLFCDLVEMLSPAGVLLVAASRLGTINHTLLTAEAINRTQRLVAIALSVRPSDSPHDAVMHHDEIQKRVDVPVFRIPRDVEPLADLFHVER
ncbi:MAG TPA: dethiobiotin synthase [Kofleriaceae bacterium]|nr:dethiobiotin synthase [Kofleriaceae bacterium]